MSPLFRYLALPLLVSMMWLGGLYLVTNGRLDRHFHGSIADRSQQASIHPVVMNSGFHLRQAIDTTDLDHVAQRLRQAPLCTWLRMEYPRKASDWTNSGTIELRLSTPEKFWTTRFRSEQITTYFQPFCFEGSQVKEVFDLPTHLDMSVVEPGLEKVAMIAMGPGDGRNNAEINGKLSEYTATYVLTANPDPSQTDMARFALIGLSSLALLLCVLIPLTARPGKPALVHPASPPLEGNNP